MKGSQTEIAIEVRDGYLRVWHRGVVVASTAHFSTPQAWAVVAILVARGGPAPAPRITSLELGL